MAKRSRKIPTPSWEDREVTIPRRLWRRISGRLYLTGSLLVLVSLSIAIVVAVFVSDFLEGQGRSDSTALAVGNAEYTLEEFADRWRLLTGPIGLPNQTVGRVIDRLTREEVARQFAGDFGVTVTEQEVDGRIRLLLTGNDGETTDEELAEVYQEELLIADLSDKEYRHMTEAQIYIDKVRDELAKVLPETAEQAKVRVAIVDSRQQGERIIERVNEGESFAEIIRRLDPSAIVDEDQLEWEVKGTLEPEADDAIFGVEVGEVGGPIVNAGELIVFQLVRKAVQEIPEDRIERLANRAFDDWVADKQFEVDVTVDILSDPEKFEWAARRVYFP